MDFPPLAWPAELHDDHFMLLDESRLPETVKYIRIDDHDGAVAAIRAMQTRAFGQLLTVLYALILTARKAASSATLQGAIDTACEVLNASRPTFAFQRYTDRVRAWTHVALQTGEEHPVDTIVRQIMDLLDRVKTMRVNRARMAAVLFDDGDKLLTHCNTSGELLLTARFCRTQGKGLTFFATETRPYFQGRLTAWEMSMDGFEVTLIPDNLSKMVADKTIEKYSVTGRQIIVYLRELEGNEEMQISYQLMAKYPLRAKTAKAVAYEYYNPDIRAEAAPVRLTVAKAK